MPRPIQSQAPGFLNLLGLKNRGELPPELAEVVSPQVDMLPFYLRGHWVGRFDAAPAPHPANVFSGYMVTATVPAHEWWYVHELTLKVQSIAYPGLARNVFGLAAAALRPQTDTVMIGPQAQNLGTTTDPDFGAYEYGAPSLRDFWLPPGGSVGGYASMLDWQSATPLQVWEFRTYTRYTSIRV